MVLKSDSRGRAFSNGASFRVDPHTTTAHQTISKLVEEHLFDNESETDETHSEEPKPSSPKQPDLDTSGKSPTDEPLSTSPVQSRGNAPQKHQRTFTGSMSDRNVAGPPPWVQPITYRERLGGYLHPRDMRRLITTFSGSNEPELIVRRHVILLNFDPLRAIVLRDRLLILVPDGADSILETLAKRIKGGMTEMEASVFGEEQLGQPLHTDLNVKEVAHKIADVITGNSEGIDDTSGAKTTDPNVSAPLTSHSSSFRKSKKDGKKRLQTIAHFEKYLSDDEGDNGDEATVSFDPFDNDEWDDLKGKGWIDLPFELQSVDAVLHTVSAMLTEEANHLQQYAYGEIDEILRCSSSAAGEHGHDILRNVKGEISEMSGRCQGFIRAINIVLDDDEDLALMNLSRLITHPERFIQPVSEEILHEESDEPELILEAYLQQSLSNVNALDLLRNQITTTEALMNMKLDSVRNRLLYINTVVSVVTLAVTVGALVGSLFGMNLYNGLEDSPTAFGQIVIGTCVGMVGMLIVLGYLFSRAGSLPRL